MQLTHSIKLGLRLFSFARPYWYLIILTIIAMVLYAALSGAPFLLIQPLTDKVVVKALDAVKLPTPKSSFNPFNELLQDKSIRECFTLVAWILLPVILAVAIFDYLKEYLYRYVTFKTIIDIRQSVTERLVNLPLSFFNEKKAGELISRVTNDVNSTQSALEFLFGDIILQPLRVLMIFGCIFLVDWRVGLIIIVLFPLFAYPILKLGRKIRRSQHQSLIKLGDLTESIHQMLTGIRVVKSFQMENEEIKEFAQENEGFFRKSLRLVRAKAFSSAFIHLAGGGVVFFSLLAGGYLVKAGLLSIGTVLSLLVFIMLLNSPLRLLVKTFNTIQAALAGAERVFEFWQLTPKPPDPPEAVELSTIRQGIKFNHVWFAYDQQPVLKDISFEVKAGEVVAIVGPTGAGKSTLLDLLARFYEPSKGSIEIDGIDLKKIKHQAWLNLVAVVGQEPFLFNTTIRDNIRYGKRDATESEIIQAAQAAYIHDFILSLPKGYDTEIGERGCKLSGGEKQRLTIARALLKNPAILLLDEATSQLDVQSEQVIQAALANLMKGRTTFVIAHRLSTIQHADKIIVLDKGEIVAQGTHTELLNQEGLYRQLYQAMFQPVKNTS